MIRGTFANIRLKNIRYLMALKAASPVTSLPMEHSQQFMMHQLPTKQPELVLSNLAGKEYGSGSSRDWAAKGTALLRCSRSNSGKLRAYSPL